jgi:type I restriction enzyme S subunit
MIYSTNENGVDILCLNVSDFKDNYKIQDCKTLSSISLNEEPASEYYLQNDDIVFVRSNGNKKLVGRCVALYPNDCKVLFSGFCIRFRKSTDNLNTDFLLHFLKTDLTREQLKGKGANIQNLNQQILANLHLPVPPLSLQTQFAAFVQQIDKSKSLAKQQIADLQELLDSKMQQYFA